MCTQDTPGSSWNVSTGTNIRIMTTTVGGSSRYRGLAVQEPFVYAGDELRRIVKFSTSNGTTMQLLTGGHAGKVVVLDWAPDGTLYSGGDGTPMQISSWHPGNGSLIQTFDQTFNYTNFGVAISGASMFAAGAHVDIFQSSRHNGSAIRRLVGHTDPFIIHIIVVGSRLYSAGWLDPRARRWSLANGTILTSYTVPSPWNPVIAAVAVVDGTLLLAQYRVPQVVYQVDEESGALFEAAFGSIGPRGSPCCGG